MNTLNRRQNAPPSLAPPGVTPNFINPINRGPMLEGVTFAMVIIALLLVVLRVLSKTLVVHAFGWDDALSCIAMVFALCRTVLTAINVEVYHLGSHIWDTEFKYYDPITRVLYICDIMYLAGVMCAKFSILLWYTRIFHVNKRFRYLCYGVMVFCGAYSIAFIFVYCFACRPLLKTWHIVTIPGECFDMIKVNYSIGALNLATDLVILMMPVPLVLKLHLHTRQKIGILGIMLTGAFVCITTIVREDILVTKVHDGDQTWVTVDDMLWLTLEFDMGIICGCLPAMVPLFAKRDAFSKYLLSYFDSRFGSFKGSKSSRSNRFMDTNSKAESEIELGRTYAVAEGTGNDGNITTGTETRDKIVQTQTFEVEYSNRKNKS